MPGELTRRRYQEYDPDSGKLALVTTHLVDDSHEGWRADLFLKNKLKRKSRQFIQKAIDQGEIVLKKRTQGEMPKFKASTILRVGDEIEIVTEPKRTEPEVDFNYEILFEDEFILVLNKPGNLPVHPAGRFFFNTLLSQLRKDRLDDFAQGEDFFVVHRLDRETSGILVVARSSEMARDMVAQFREHRVEKKYHAIVHGHLEQNEVFVDRPMVSAPRSEVRLKMSVSDTGEGWEALTHFRVLRRMENALGKFTLVEATPKTGRQHQIRVHLAHLGHPIVGDKLYGSNPDVFLQYLETGVISEEQQRELGYEQGLRRHALHACFIRFQHPKSKEFMSVRCLMPTDMRDFIEG